MAMFETRKRQGKKEEGSEQTDRRRKGVRFGVCSASGW